MEKNIDKKQDILVYQNDDGQVRLDVRLEGVTVWLTQSMLADLFQTTQQNISQHILNIYDEKELDQGATHKKFLSVRSERGRQVQRKLDFYIVDIHIGLIVFQPQRDKIVYFKSFHHN